MFDSMFFFDLSNLRYVAFDSNLVVAFPNDLIMAFSFDLIEIFPSCLIVAFPNDMILEFPSDAIVAFPSNHIAAFPSIYEMTNQLKPDSSSKVSWSSENALCIFTKPFHHELGVAQGLFK